MIGYAGQLVALIGEFQQQIAEPLANLHFSDGKLSQHALRASSRIRDAMEPKLSAATGPLMHLIGNPQRIDVLVEAGQKLAAALDTVFEELLLQANPLGGGYELRNFHLFTRNMKFLHAGQRLAEDWTR